MKDIIETLQLNTDTQTFNKVEELQHISERMLRLLGEDPRREGLVKTPARYSKALSFLTSGHSVAVNEIVGDAIFNEPSSELVLIKNIEFYSLCEHHMLPFFGKAHVAYVPNGKVIGLSKIPRIVDVFARRLQVQERLTSDVARCLNSLLNAKGVAVYIDASHLCMMMRGVQKQSSTTTTKSLLGEFRNNEGLRMELLSLLKSE